MVIIGLFASRVLTGDWDFIILVLGAISLGEGVGVGPDTGGCFSGLCAGVDCESGDLVGDSVVVHVGI